MPTEAYSAVTCATCCDACGGCAGNATIRARLQPGGAWRDGRKHDVAGAVRDGDFATRVEHAIDRGGADFGDLQGLRIAQIAVRDL